MIYCRFDAGSGARWGIVDHHEVVEIEGVPYESTHTTGEPYKFPEIEFLAPAEPGKILAIGLNYKHHAEEMQEKLPAEPLIFLKAPTALQHPGRPIVLPSESHSVESEGELAFIVKRRAKNVPFEEAAQYIWGYTCLNDVTARDLQKKDRQWARAKSFDTFCPTGPWVVTDLPVENVSIETYVNGELRCQGKTSDLIFSPAQILCYASRMMTLEAGDLITTGTPAGVGPLKPGDIVDVRIEGVGVLRNPVVSS